MSDNSNSALSYHEETKHSELSVRMSAHYLDWNNKPSPFKHYRNLPSIPLPRNFPHPREESLRAIRGFYPIIASKRLDVGILAEILFFSAGLTRRVSMGTGPYYMRAAPATGALYPIELYVICGDIPGLRAGVYHFNPLDFALVRLREGDYRAELGAPGHEENLTCPVTIALTSLAWRNAWKYGARSYRHWFWDSGAIAANLLATSASEALIAKLTVGFVDSEVDRLLGLVKGKEATVALAPIGLGLPQQAERTAKASSRLDLEVEPLSQEEVEYPIIWKANEASSLRGSAEAKEWGQSFKSRTNGNRADGATFPLRPLKEGDSPVPSLEEVILRRGSTRKFARQPISFEQLSTIVDASATVIPLDFLPHRETAIDFYFIANEVSGLPSGSYFFDRRAKFFVQLKDGNLRNTSGYLCLEQPLFSDASVVFYLMTDLRRVVSSLGERGYRAAQFEAGIRAGKIYLSSYSLGMGASGSTFYDDAVTEFFSPHAKGKSTMIAVGIGVPAYRARTGRILPQMSAKARTG
ncbi:MAG: SagB/ThcOx family dehydrogenase [Thaumarchaeota archaeon]|nr:SagB/ThcOx family dehydrogenase [Nitrososphaerota archaeon]